MFSLYRNKIFLVYLIILFINPCNYHCTPEIVISGSFLKASNIALLILNIIFSLE
jgi:hypothetical protein